jgi:restriction endonuclease S subunit
MNPFLKKIGIRDESFELLTVRQLVGQKILDKPLDGNHGELHPKADDFVSEGVPFIMASDVKDSQVDYTSCKFITAKQADRLRKGFARNGDVLVTHKATIGRTAIVKYDRHPYVMLTPQVTYYRVKDRRRLNNRYLHCYFRSELFQKTLSLWADSGSTRAYLGITEQQKLPIIIPPIQKQLKIAGLVSAYGELIQDNKQRIALLEELAEEIYSEWFVRFRFPGRENARVVKGVPDGWRNRKFGEFRQLQRGYDLPDAKVEPGPYPVMASTSIKAYHAQYKVEPPVITTGRSGSLGTVLFVNAKAWPHNTALYVKRFFDNSPFLIFYTLKNMKLENFNAGAGVRSFRIGSRKLFHDFIVRWNCSEELMRIWKRLASDYCHA